MLTSIRIPLCLVAWLLAPAIGQDAPPKPRTPYAPAASAMGTSAAVSCLAAMSSDWASDATHSGLRAAAQMRAAADHSVAGCGTMADTHCSTRLCSSAVPAGDARSWAASLAC